MAYIGQNIKYLRNFASITQVELANVLDLNRSAIGSYEEKRSEPPYEAIIKIAHFFDVRIHDLVTVDFQVQDLLLNSVPDTKLYSIEQYREKQHLSDVNEQAIRFLRQINK